MKVRDEKGISVKKEQDFSEWYSQLIQKAELAEYTDVSGCYILRPRAFAVWEKIREYFDLKIKDSGVKNLYFPIISLVISITSLASLTMLLYNSSSILNSVPYW